MTDPTDSRPRPEASRQPRRHFSLTGQVALGAIATAVLAAAATATGRSLGLGPFTAALLSLALAVPLGAWLIHRLLAPLDTVLRDVADGIRSFRDRDFSVRLSHRRKDELGELVSLYNEVGEILHDERSAVRQRELLLQSALDRSPAAILLLNPLDRIIYANLEARRLLTGGARLEGYSFEQVRRGCPPEMREILDGESDGLFTVPGRDQTETFSLSQRRFQLNRRPHTLILLRRLTGELGRREAEAWKKVIRVISHELNNSLAPVSSLVHSAQKIADDPRHADRATEVFESIRERLDHLHRFIEGYARFARLPRPRRESVSWPDFLSGLAEYRSLSVAGHLPSEAGYFDPAQMRQVLDNLLKNAEEASDGEPAIVLRVQSTPDGTYLQVTDQGRGMDQETREKALLPFYSTKQSGTGLGLALCREIIEAHGGRISLEPNQPRGTVVTCWLPPR